MDAFFLIFTNMLPLYALIGVGWIAGRFFEIDRASLGNLVIFIFLPVVAFYFVSKVEFTPAYLLLPALNFSILCVVAWIALKVGRKIYPDGRANLLSMCSTWGNTGYFALPLVMLYFTPEHVGIYMFMMIGGLFFEATVGYYIMMRGKLTVGESLKKLAKFPTPYAVVAALVVNALNIQLPDLVNGYFEHFKGGYIVLGMMIIGIALSRVKHLVIGPKFITVSFLGKFFIWPLLGLSFIELDKAIMQLYDADIYRLIIILSTVPMGANIAAYATQLDLNPEKAATTVLLSTFFALIYVPLVFLFFGIY